MAEKTYSEEKYSEEKYSEPIPPVQADAVNDAVKTYRIALEADCAIAALKREARNARNYALRVATNVATNPYKFTSEQTPKFTSEQTPMAYCCSFHQDGGSTLDSCGKY